MSQLLGEYLPQSLPPPVNAGTVVKRNGATKPAPNLLLEQGLTRPEMNGRRTSPPRSKVAEAEVKVAAQEAKTVKTSTQEGKK